MAYRRERLSSAIAADAVRAWPATLALALTVLLCTWVFGVPRYGAPDEVNHTTKAYGTARGETIGSPVPEGSPLDRYFDVPAGLITGNPCFAFHPEINASCAVAYNDPHIVQYATSAATYPPGYYAVVGGVTRLLGTDQSALSYRLISALIGAALLVVALSLLRRAGDRRAALALVALNPMTLFIVASTNPASTEIAGTLLLWAYLAVLLTGTSVATQRQLVLATSIAAGIVVVRPVALPWVAIAVAAFLVLEQRPFAPDRRTTLGRLGWAALPLLAAIAVSSAWSRYAGVGLADDKYVVSDGTTTILRTGLGRTSELFRQAFGSLGWLDTELPTPTYALWIVCLVLIGTLVAFCTERRVQIVLAAIATIWVFYPVLYVVFAKTPLVWQGRYNLPLMGGVVLCALMAGRTTPWPSQADTIARFCAVAWVVIEVAAFYQTMRRFMVSSTGSLLLRGGWTPPINVWLLLTGNLLMAVTIAWLLTRPVPSV